MMDRGHKLAQFREQLGIAEGRNEPATWLMDAAMWDVPDVIEDIERDMYLPQGNKDGDAVAAKNLIFRLTGKKHTEEAASWAIYRLIGSERLGAELATIRYPKPAEPSGSTTIVGVGGDDISIIESPSARSDRKPSQGRPLRPGCQTA